MAIQDAERLIKDLKHNRELHEKLNKAGAKGFEATAKEAGYETNLHEFENALKAAVVKADLTHGPGAPLASINVSSINIL